MAMTKDRAELIRNWLKDLAGLPNPATDEAGWIALKLSCSRAKAQKTIDEAKRVLGNAWGPA